MISQVKFVSLNIGMKNNLAGLQTIVHTHKLDLIFLQEVKVNKLNNYWDKILNV